MAITGSISFALSGIGANAFGSQSLEEAFYSKVMSVVEITSVLGDRLFPYIASERSDTPYGVYMRSSASRELNLSGPQCFARAGIGVDLYASSVSQLVLLREAFRKALHGDSGVWGRKQIYLCSVVDEDGVFEDEPGLYSASLDLMILYKEDLT